MVGSFGRCAPTYYGGKEKMVKQREESVREGKLKEAKENGPKGGYGPKGVLEQTITHLEPKGQMLYSPMASLFVEGKGMDTLSL